MEDNTMMQDVNVENVMDSINEVTDLVPTTDDDLNVVEDNGISPAMVAAAMGIGLTAIVGAYHIGKWTVKQVKKVGSVAGDKVGNLFKKKTDDETETIETVEAEVVENETK